MLVLVAVFIFFSDTPFMFRNSVVESTTTIRKGETGGGDESKKKRQHRLSICQALHPKSSNALWIEHRINILNSSIIEKNESLPTIMNRRRLLASLTPRLPLSVQTNIQRDPTLWESILQKLMKRYEFMQEMFEANMNMSSYHTASTSMPPPVRVVVLGGSVTRGVRCFLAPRTNSKPKNTSSTAQALDEEFRTCAWPNRLENLINQLAWNYLSSRYNTTTEDHIEELPKLVEIRNEAVGATNTAVGTPLLKYRVLPSLETADVLIHAYSTNDVGLGVATENRTYQTLLSLQEFMRAAMQFRQADCSHAQNPLLVIHVNDFVGPMARPLLQEPWYEQIVYLLSTYYGFPSMSYPAMVQDVINGDPRETWFSADEYTNGQYGYELHPGQTFHYGMALMLLYNFLHWSTAFCDMDLWKRHVAQEENEDVDTDDSDELETRVVGRRNQHLLQPYEDTILADDYISESIESLMSKEETALFGVLPRGTYTCEPSRYIDILFLFFPMNCDLSSVSQHHLQEFRLD